MNIPNVCHNTVPAYVVDEAVDMWNQSGKRHWIPISGCSMFPLLQEGDKVLVTHNNNGIRNGDVIVFHLSEIVVIHRVLRIYGSKTKPIFLTKGDNTPRFDYPIGISKIVGRVIAIERGNRYMLLDTTKKRILSRFIVVLQTLQGNKKGT